MPIKNKTFIILITLTLALLSILPNDNTSEETKITIGFSKGVWYEHIQWSIGAPSGDKNSDEYKKYEEYYNEYLKGVLFYNTHIKKNYKLKNELTKTVKDAGINDDNIGGEKQSSDLLVIVQKLVNKVKKDKHN